MKEKKKLPFYKKKWLWIVAIVVVLCIVAANGDTGRQANETTKSTGSSQTETTKSDSKARLTLDDNWQLDTSNPYSTKVVGYVSNNSNDAIKGYIQITFSALDASGANVGDCLANANTVDAKGKWKFEAICLGNDVATVRFKDITGF